MDIYQNLILILLINIHAHFKGVVNTLPKLDYYSFDKYPPYPTSKGGGYLSKLDFFVDKYPPPPPPPPPHFDGYSHIQYDELITGYNKRGEYNKLREWEIICGGYNKVGWIFIKT